MAEEAEPIEDVTSEAVEENIDEAQELFLGEQTEADESGLTVEEEPGPDDSEEPELVLSNSGVTSGLVYNGEVQPLVIAEDSMLYSLDGENFSAEAPTGIDAGEYTVYIKPVDGGEVLTLSVTIEKADVIFTPPTANI